MSELLPVKIQGVVVDPVSRGFAVIIRDDAGNRWLPIYIGPFEAQSIAMELENQKLLRPATHDLLKNTIEGLGYIVTKAAIVSLKENTYYAVLSLRSETGSKDLDCRPSDAIAVALRAHAPILVADDIFDRAGTKEAPHDDDISKQLTTLQAQLNALIEGENYEEAARVRDQINKLKANKGS